MKLRQITLENFGCYKHKTFDFHEAPLVCIYGANEAGKTTALNGIRQAIFGFRQRASYGTSTNTHAEIEATTRDGGILQFSRRKGRPDKVSGTLNGIQIDDNELTKLLCDLDSESYESLFGFSQEELRLGQETLKGSRVSEALAGGGFGGIQALEALRTELTDTLTDLYKSRGKNAKINFKLDEIAAARNELKELSTLPSTVEELRQQLRTAEQESSRLQKKAEELQRRALTAQRLLEALPCYRELATIKLNLKSIDVPDGIDSQFAAKWSDYAEQRQDLKIRCEKERAALEEEEAQLAMLQGDGIVLEHENAIESLGHQVAAISEIRNKLPGRKELLHKHELNRNALLEQLGLESVCDELESFSIDAPTKSNLLDLADELQRRKSEIVRCRAKLESCTETLQQLKAGEPEEVAPNNWVELAKLIERLQQLEQECQQKSEMLSASQEDAEFVELCSRVESLLCSSPATDWQLPAEESLNSLRSELSVKEQALADAKSNVKRQEDGLRELKSSPTQTQNDHDAATLLEKSQQFSIQRQAIIEQWLDELSQPLIAASISIEQQQERLSELGRIGTSSDQVQSDLLSVADQLAASNNLQKQIASLNKKLSDAQKTESTRSAELEVAHGAWKAAWSHLPLNSLDVAKLQNWAIDFRSWKARTKKLHTLRKELQRSRSSLKAVKGQLLDQWPGNLRMDICAKPLLEQSKKWEAGENARERNSEQIRTSESLKTTLKKQLAELQTQEESCVKTITAWLDTVPISLDWPAEKVSSLIDSVERLRQEHTQAEATRAGVFETEKILSEFEQDLAELQQTLGRQLPQTLPETIASQLFSELKKLREQKSKRLKLNESIKHRTKRKTELDTALQELDSKLAALCASATANGGNPVEMSSLMERLHTAEKLRLRASELNATLSGFCPDGNTTSFTTTLENADEASLQVGLRDCNAAIAENEATRKSLHEEIGQFNERIDRVANSARSQKASQALQNFRGELVELSEQWIVTRLAQELLNRSVEWYARENEPELLKFSRQYLSSLTGGRYIDVEHDKSMKGQFSIRNQEGESFAPDRLSTGTREQLYLAIRMAYIRQHSQKLEPLPVIMDDCFVNFDDDRTRMTLETINEWDSSTQTIILSCHSRVPKLLTEIAPATPIISLDTKPSPSNSDFSLAAT